jgi:hypothetical protein
MNTSSIISSSTTASPALAGEASSAFTHFVLRQIGCAKLRAELVANQADMAITALSAGLITPEMALLVLAECGLPLGEVSS